MSKTNSNSGDYFYTIEQSSVAEFKDKGSKFLAQAFAVTTVDDCKKIIKEVKELHPKANHNCFAYRLGLDENNYRSSDDGEPSGSAGKPILGQIDSKGVTNVLVIVTRYFGGTLLGVPGLINAYKTATALVLQTTPIIQKQVMQPISIECEYTLVNQVLHIAKTHQCEVVKQNMQLFAQLQINVPKNRMQEVRFRLEHIYGVTIV